MRLPTIFQYIHPKLRSFVYIHVGVSLKVAISTIVVAQRSSLRQPRNRLTNKHPTEQRQALFILYQQSPLWRLFQRHRYLSR
jgi:hypothetical protein